MSWLTRLIHKAPAPQKTSQTDIVNLIRSHDVTGLLGAFSLGDWEARELVAAALGNICRDSTPDVDYDREEMAAVLWAIIDLCNADSTGGDYRQNCLDHAYMLLDRPEFNQSDVAPAADEATTFYKVARECNDPLIDAVKAGEADKVAQLLEAGANPNACDGLDDPALVIAADEGHSDIVEQLLAHGADPNRSGDFGTPLNRAAEKGHEGIVRTLLAAGADVNGRDSRGGRTPVDSAEATGHFEIARIFYDAGGRPGTNRGEHLMSAAMAGSLERVSYYLASGDDIAPAHLNEALLFLGMADATHRSDSVAIANLLLDAGADPNFSDSDGKTPLLVASACQNDDLVRLLVERGADGTAIGYVATSAPMPPEVGIAEGDKRALDTPLLDFLDAIAEKLRFDPGLCVDGLHVLKFPEGFEDAYQKHLSLVEHLKSLSVYPSLTVYGLRSATPEASVARLILVTGDRMACEQFSGIFYAPEAERFIAAECAGDWAAINPASSVSNVADAGMSADLVAVVREAELLARELRAGTYSIDRKLDWDWRG